MTITYQLPVRSCQRCGQMAPPEQITVTANIGGIGTAYQPVQIKEVVFKCLCADRLERSA